VVAKKMNDRLADLERRLRGATPDPEAERRWREDVATLDAFAALVRDSGGRLADLQAHVSEHAPELGHYQQQLAAKRLLVLEAPGGEALWRRLCEMKGGEFAPILRDPRA
jgi:hypothetical protein